MDAFKEAGGKNPPELESRRWLSPCWAHAVRHRSATQRSLTQDTAQLKPELRESAPLPSEEGQSPAASHWVQPRLAHAPTLAAASAPQPRAYAVHGGGVAGVCGPQKGCKCGGVGKAQKRAAVSDSELKATEVHLQFSDCTVANKRRKCCTCLNTTSGLESPVEILKKTAHLTSVTHFLCQTRAFYRSKYWFWK